MSQNLFQFVNMAEKYGGVPIVKGNRMNCGMPSLFAVQINFFSPFDIQTISK